MQVLRLEAEEAQDGERSWEAKGAAGGGGGGAAVEIRIVDEDIQMADGGACGACGACGAGGAQVLGC